MKSVDIPEKMRSKIYKRDMMMCQLCGSRCNLHIHHILYRSQLRNGHFEWNLILLCERCHRIAHSDKNKWQPRLLSLAGGDMWYSKIDKTDLSDAVVSTLGYCKEIQNSICQSDIIEL